VLFDRFGCKLQMGGSDQWGNITSGIDLIERMRSDPNWQPSREGERKPPLAHGVVFPLVTTAAGTKFGKTEAGTVWLDPKLTSPFRFYQFWLNTDDRDVDKYLKFFTWLSREEIEELARSREAAPEKRDSQIRLAREVTRTLHGETALAAAERASSILFGEEITGLEPGEVADIFADVPSSEVSKSRLEGAGVTVVDLLIEAGLAPSKGEARRSITAGGIYLNNQRSADEKRMVTLQDAIGGRFLVFRKGRKTYHLVRVTDGSGGGE
jgi:tyrosyl-tRNA synthetase